MRVLAGKINMASKWVWLGPLIAVLALLVGAVIAVAISWVVMSYGTFPDRIMPGDTYTVAGYTLQVPNLPHKQYGSSEVPSMTRPVPKLSNQTLEDIHRLGVDVHTSLDEADVQHWMTGGTLIGLKLWNSKMVFDDDIDLAVRWQDREYAWSPEFAAMLARHGLETFYLRGASLKWATREGAAVRIRRQGTVVPTCDIFFVQSRDDGTWAKVNSWHGDKVVHEPKETCSPWEPLRRKACTGRWAGSQSSYLENNTGPTGPSTSKARRP